MFGGQSLSSVDAYQGQPFPNDAPYNGIYTPNTIMLARR